MAFINAVSTFLAVPMPKGLWEWLIGTVFSFIGNYGLRIVVFTILLKLLLFPLDIYQKKTMRDNAKKMERIQPEIEKLKAQYGDDKASIQRAQSALMKKEKYNMFASCLPMIVTMVIFFSMYAGFMNISSYKMIDTYETLVSEYDAYYYNTPDADNKYTITLEMFKAEVDEIKADELAAYKTANPDPSKTDAQWEEAFKAAKVASYRQAKPVLTESEAEAWYDNTYTAAVTDLTMTVETKDEPEWVINDRIHKAFAEQAVTKKYDELKESFLWVGSIWMPDVPWEKPIQSYEQFKSNAQRSSLFGGKFGADYFKDDTKNKNLNQDTYDKVMGGLTLQNQGANGYLVLVILSGGLSFLLQFISQRQQKKNGTPNPNMGDPAAMGALGGMGGTMKMMMYLMPVMMCVFAATSSSAFSIYMCSNSLMSLLLLLVTESVLKLLEKIKEKRDSERVHVLRVAPGEEKKRRDYRLKGDVDEYNRKNKK